jgi:hypothetical protein
MRAATFSMAPYVPAVDDTSTFVGLTVGVELAHAGGADTSPALDNARLDLAQ